MGHGRNEGMTPMERMAMAFVVRRWAGAVCVAALVLVVGHAARADEPAPAKSHRTDWFHDAGWGVFTHYLSGIALKGQPQTVDAWNDVVDRFDVNGLADQLASVGAKYYVITIGQNSGYYIAPNATYDKIVGISPSKCAKRDLVSDLYAALHLKGIRLMVYLPSGAPDRDPEAMKALGWKNGKYPLWKYPKGGPNGGDDRLVGFQKKWQAIIRDWSMRWGTKVCGWWFDGCYFPIAMYEHPDPPNFESFAAAARAGNPDSIVAFNPGVQNPITCLTPVEDYTAGEINDAAKVVCPGRWLDGAQYHMLSFLGPYWAQSPPRYTNQQVIDITRGITQKGGVVTWDVPIQPSGLIAQPFIRQLNALHDGLANK